MSNICIHRLGRPEDPKFRWDAYRHRPVRFYRGDFGQLFFALPLESYLHRSDVHRDDWLQLYSRSSTMFPLQPAQQWSSLYDFEWAVRRLYCQLCSGLTIALAAAALTLTAAAISYTWNVCVHRLGRPEDPKFRWDTHRHRPVRFHRGDFGQLFFALPLESYLHSSDVHRADCLQLCSRSSTMFPVQPAQQWSSLYDFEWAVRRLYCQLCSGLTIALAAAALALKTTNTSSDHIRVFRFGSDLRRSAICFLGSH